MKDNLKDFERVCEKKFSKLYQIEIVTVLACVTRKVLGKEVLGHLGGVGQYYR